MRISPFVAVAVLFAGCADDSTADEETQDPGVPGPSATFLDDAENGTGAWTLQSNVVIIDFTGNAPTQELDQEHEAGSWQVSTAQAHNGTSSFYSQYPDNYRARMTTMVEPANATTLSFWYKGGAETNGYDGLYLFVDGVQVAMYAEPVTEWTLAEFAIPAGSATIEFRFDADPSCSNESGIDVPPPGEPICGAGWDAGGFYIDDILVA